MPSWLSRRRQFASVHPSGRPLLPATCMLTAPPGAGAGQWGWFMRSMLVSQKRLQQLTHENGMSPLFKTVFFFFFSLETRKYFLEKFSSSENVAVNVCSYSARCFRNQTERSRPGQGLLQRLAGVDPSGSGMEERAFPTACCLRLTQGEEARSSNTQHLSSGRDGSSAWATSTSPQPKLQPISGAELCWSISSPWSCNWVQAESKRNELLSQPSEGIMLLFSRSAFTLFPFSEMLLKQISTNKPTNKHSWWYRH